MNDGTRTAGAAAKGKAAAIKQKESGKPPKGNPYGEKRPGMKKAWQAAFDEELSGEPAPEPAKPKGKPGRKPKGKPAPEPAPIPDDEAITIDEPIEPMPADDADGDSQFSDPSN